MSGMCSFTAILVVVLTTITSVQPRPPSPITYFPDQPHPWSVDDDNDRNNYIDSYKQSLGQFDEDVLPKSKPDIKFFPSIKVSDGFVPADLTALNNVYWWKKRFQGFRDTTDEDLPYFDNVDQNSIMDTFHKGSIKKRDYTAAQLVNMLKALAKARRQRQIRITGKGLRFGISK